MLNRYRDRAARLVLALLGLGLTAGAAPNRELSAAPAEAINVSSNGARLWVESPFLHLEFDLQHPSLDVMQVAPQGDGHFGASIGAIVEEAWAQGHLFRSATDDRDGARASWETRPDAAQLRLEGFDAGALATTSWTVTVRPDSPTLRIERQTTLRGGGSVDALGLAVVSASVPDGTDPSSLAHILNGATYRLEVGPATLEQAGGTLGLLAVDNPELSYSARTDQPDRVAARQDGSSTNLAFVRRVGSRQIGELREAIDFRFGWQNDFVAAHSDLTPGVESRLLAAGYFGNAVISPNLGVVLSASMRDYRGSVWSRDSDYALQGYSYVLSDMSAFGNTIQKFIERIDNQGVAPEYLLLDGRYGNRESWDSMANVIQATYSYVAKTADVDFYRRNEAALKKAATWIRGLDTNNDGLPDRDIFPYGYTDTVENGPMHTYAIAKFYSAIQALAELDDAIGKNGQNWRDYARAMQASFSRPMASGGYWNPATGYPIAWKRADGQVFTGFESFGIFEAIRVGLLSDPAQLQGIASWLDANRDVFLNSNAYPERLMVGGYDLSVKKAEVPLDKLWIMDCNAPWITGVSVPARVRLGRLADAGAMLGVYASSSNRSTPHAEFGAGPLGRYGAGETLDGGRLWDNWSWFSAVYGTHFGLKMTIPALEVAPAPLDPAAGRHLFDVSYQGARVQMQLSDDGYTIVLDTPKPLVLRPPFGYNALDVNGDGNVQPVRTLTAQAGAPYVIRAYK
jgi:hypothetical protein